MCGPAGRLGHGVEFLWAHKVLGRTAPVNLSHAAMQTPAGSSANNPALFLCFPLFIWGCFPTQLSTRSQSPAEEGSGVCKEIFPTGMQTIFPTGMQTMRSLCKGLNVRSDGRTV